VLSTGTGVCGKLSALMSKPVPVPQLPPEDASEDLFDYQQIKDYVGFVFGSLRRHRRLWIGGAVLASVLALTLVRMLPRTYNVQTKLLAQRNQIMAQLGNPHRAIQFDSDAPTRAAFETVLSRDNLVALIKQTKLVEHWETHRIPLLRFKDLIFQVLRGKLSDEEKLDAMVGTLEKRLFVVTNEGTITIGIDWPDAQMAHQLVETAQQNFLEQRHVSEVNAISEAISILETHASQAQVAIEDAMAEVQKVAEAKRTARAIRPASTPREATTTAGGETPAQELAQLKFLIRSKRRAIADLEEFRSRRLTELQAQMAEQKVIYSANHPAVLDTDQRIAAMQLDSPQIQALKKDEEQLLAEYRARGGKDPNSSSEGSGSRASADTLAAEFTMGAMTLDDPVVTVARDQLRIATAKYHDLMMRIDGAKIELDTARAAFKFRYSVVSPPQIPKKPIKPNIAMLSVAGVLASFVFGIFAVVVLDLWRGKLLERWQVERRLKIPVLGDVELS